jgi:hypothetical protein
MGIAKDRGKKQSQHGRYAVNPELKDQEGLDLAIQVEGTPNVLRGVDRTADFGFQGSQSSVDSAKQASG